jgi:hypothetical protein
VGTAIENCARNASMAAVTGWKDFILKIFMP